ncbi:MAG: peptide-methionine (S)-S-oxide reductase MsrA [Ginsengibacter sp.]
MIQNKNPNKATFANGCLWRSQHFRNVKGILNVTNGYSGGFVVNPTYEEVLDRNTGHALSLMIEYDPNEIRYENLLELFWQSHDPTSLGSQRQYLGPQYRSIIFYHNESQKEKALLYKKKLNESGLFDLPVVTLIEAFTNFYPAEDQQSNYQSIHKKSNCTHTIKSKSEKIKSIFSF